MAVALDEIALEVAQAFSSFDDFGSFLDPRSIWDDWPCGIDTSAEALLALPEAFERAVKSSPAFSVVDDERVDKLVADGAWALDL